MLMKTSLRALGGLAAAAVVLTAAPGAPAATGAPALTRPVQATKADMDPGRLYSSPAFAIDPADPHRIVAGFADLRTRRCGIVRSVDGARTWTRPDGSPQTAAYPFCSQSQGGVIQAPVAFGGKGRLYMALGGWGSEEAARAGGAIMVASTDNLGDTWNTTVVRTARGKVNENQENLRPAQSIAVERKNGSDDVVYVTFALTRPGLTAPNGAPATPMVAVSHDGGKTFAEAMDLSAKFFDNQAVRDQAFSAVTTTVPAPGATTTTVAPTPAGSKAATPNQAANFGSAGSRNGMIARTDGKGNVYVTWPTGTANLANSPPGGLALSKSTDGGKTWATSLALPFSYENATGGPAGAYPQMVVSPTTGALHIAFNRNPTPELAGASDVYVRSSYDGGKTWTEPKNIGDDDPKVYAGQYFPNLSIAPNGRIDVAWWDTRDTPGQRFNDVYYAYSTDDGKTWSKNQRISDQSVDRRLGIWGLNYDIASQPGVTSTNEYAVFGWDDTRNSDKTVKDNAYLGGGLQDIYIAAAQFQALGGGTSSTAKVVLAGVVGLLAVGFVLILAAALTRRRRPAGPDDAAHGRRPTAAKVPTKTS